MLLTHKPLHNFGEETITRETGARVTAKKGFLEYAYLCIRQEQKATHAVPSAACKGVAYEMTQEMIEAKIATLMLNLGDLEREIAKFPDDPRYQALFDANEQVQEGLQFFLTDYFDYLQGYLQVIFDHMNQDPFE